VRALVAKSLSENDVDAARAALDLAERLDDPVLRYDAFGALKSVLEDGGEFAGALDAAERRSELLPQVADPDRVAEGHLVNCQLYVALGRLGDARAEVARLEETVAGLSPHHRVHGLEVRMLLESAEADWDAIRELTHRAEQLIEANLATPCPFNRGLLILLATGWTYAGDAAEAERLLARAEQVGMATYLRVHSPRWLALAIARSDRAEIRRLIDAIQPGWLIPSLWELWARLFDGLAELDDRDRIETEAPQWLDRDLYVTPFATRALALARRDAALLDKAAAQFEAMGLDRHAEQTRATSLPK
jgi:hypothetical protein